MEFRDKQQDWVKAVSPMWPSVWFRACLSVCFSVCLHASLSFYWCICLRLSVCVCLSFALSKTRLYIIIIQLMWKQETGFWVFVILSDRKNSFIRIKIQIWTFIPRLKQLLCLTLRSRDITTWHRGPSSAWCSNQFGAWCSNQFGPWRGFRL